MTLVDTTVRSQTDSISFEFDLPHSPQKVWRALTDPVLLAEWLLPVVGLDLTLERNPKLLSDHNVVFISGVNEDLGEIGRAHV